VSRIPNRRVRWSASCDRRQIGQGASTMPMLGGRGWEQGAAGPLIGIDRLSKQGTADPQCGMEHGAAASLEARVWSADCLNRAVGDYPILQRCDLSDFSGASCIRFPNTTMALALIALAVNAQDVVGVSNRVLTRENALGRSDDEYRPATALGADAHPIPPLVGQLPHCQEVCDFGYVFFTALVLAVRQYADDSEQERSGISPPSQRLGKTEERSMNLEAGLGQGKGEQVTRSLTLVLKSVFAEHDNRAWQSSSTCAWRLALTS
jgi:hypothetical protein